MQKTSSFSNHFYGAATLLSPANNVKKIKSIKGFKGFKDLKDLKNKLGNTSNCRRQECRRAVNTWLLAGDKSVAAP